MKNRIIKIVTIVMLTNLAIVSSGCKKDYTDPSRANEEEALNSPRGLTGIAIGLQRVYTLSRASNL